MKMSEIQREIWNFSREKSKPLFVRDGTVIIRPVKESDTEFYLSVRMQYSMIYRIMISQENRRREDLFLLDLCQPESFYGIIEDTSRVPVGYIGIKDTCTDIWELAIELDKQHTRRGLGPRSIILFLNEVHRITGRTTFKVKVEPDNIPSQKCFERLGAVLTGLCDSPLLKTPEEKEQFERKNLNLIDDNMRSVADRLVVEPQKLLSHVLEYRVKCPL